MERRNNKSLESVKINPLSREITHGNLSIAAMELARKQESITICFNRKENQKLRSEVFEAVFIDNAWENDGKVSLHLGMMIENYSPQTSN